MIQRETGIKHKLLTSRIVETLIGATTVVNVALVDILACSIAFVNWYESLLTSTMIPW